MRSAARLVLVAFGLAALSLALSGCFQSVVRSALTDAGIDYRTERLLDAAERAAPAIMESVRPVTEPEEYYLGRAVAANIYARYRPLTNPGLNRYVSMVGLTVARASGRPETFGGYNFAVLDSPELNAFAAPGGFVFVTRGVLEACRSEEELAAVLAHEVAHVELQHGLAAIKQSRLQKAFGLIARHTAEVATPDWARRMAKPFEGAIGDIVSQLVTKGYSREQEYEADARGVAVAAAAGYDPQGLSRFLERLSAQTAFRASGAGFLGKTHPAPKRRLEALNRVSGVREVASPLGVAGRNIRFLETMMGRR